MKRLVVLAGLIAAVCLTVQSASAAGTLAINDKVKLTNGPGDTSGGEFGIYETAAEGSGSVDYNFRTFCVEVLQGINFSEEFYVGGINLFSRASATSTNPLTQMAAALFREYAVGLAAYIESNGAIFEHAFFGNASAKYKYVGSTDAKSLMNPPSSSDADSLQAAIWGAQGQPGYPPAVNKFTTAYFNAGTVNVGGVAILDLRADSATSSKYQQDQLYWLGGGDELKDVPEPTSLALFGLGMVGAGFANRRRKKIAG